MSNSTPSIPATPVSASLTAKSNSLSRFSTRLKQIKINLRNISDNLHRKAADPKQKTTTADEMMVLHLQQEIAELVVLFPRIEKLLIQFETNTFHRALRFLRLSSKDRELTVLFEYIEMAIEILSHEQPSLLVARKMRIDIERTVTRHQHPLLGIFLNRFRDIYRSDSDPLKVVCGLTFTTVVSAGLFFGSLVGISRQGESKLDDQINGLQDRLSEIQEELASDNIFITDDAQIIQGENPGEGDNAFGDAVGGLIATQNQQELIREFRQKRLRQRNLVEIRDQERQDASILFLIILVVSSGTLGSAISILIRINDFEKQEVSDPLIPIFTGAFKPIIGSSFGLLMYALFSSGVISVQIVPNNTARGTEFFFCSLAFVIGFSERLAKDVIKKTEERLLGAESGAQPLFNQRPQTSALPFYPLPIAPQEDAAEE
ncbi:MAG: hypothetical protein F6J87_18825 [Spirulina sp. SIO3F2]|nr:hypothetical protein [Spirulina sp. SIO3F2]